MRCLYCGYENAPDAVFCENCGKPLAGSDQEPAFFCPECGTENEADALYCEGCGNRLGVRTPGEVPPQKSKRALLIIGVLLVVIVCLGAGGFFAYRIYEDHRSEIAEETEEEEIREAKADKKKQDTEKEETAKDTKEDDEAEEEPEDAGGEASEPKQQPEQSQPEQAPTQQAQAPVITMQNVSGVSASSELAEANMVHSASRTMDGDKNTAWVEGADGQGYGQSIRFDFNNVYLVSDIRIRAGYHKNDDIYYKNSRPKEICMEYSDGTSEILYLNDVGLTEQVLTFSRPVETSMVNLIIESVYPGVKYEDTCISEITFF